MKILSKTEITNNIDVIKHHIKKLRTSLNHLDKYQNLNNLSAFLFMVIGIFSLVMLLYYKNYTAGVVILFFLIIPVVITRINENAEKEARENVSKNKNEISKNLKILMNYDLLGKNKVIKDIYLELMNIIPETFFYRKNINDFLLVLTDKFEKKNNSYNFWETYWSDYIDSIKFDAEDYKLACQHINKEINLYAYDAVKKKERETKVAADNYAKKMKKDELIYELTNTSALHDIRLIINNIQDIKKHRSKIDIPKIEKAELISDSTFNLSIKFKKDSFNFIITSLVGNFNSSHNTYNISFFYNDKNILIFEYDYKINSYNGEGIMLQKNISRMNYKLIKIKDKSWIKKLSDINKNLGKKIVIFKNEAEDKITKDKIDQSRKRFSENFEN